MNAPKHTPTPYKINPGERGSFYLTAENDIAVCQTYEPNQGMHKLRGAASPAADAAFIGRACNAHDTLVEALETLLRTAFSGDDVRLLCVGMNGQMMSNGSKEGTAIHARCDLMNAGADKARAALKLARGE